MSEQVNPEISLLHHLNEIHRLMTANPDAADAVKDKLDILPAATSIRSLAFAKKDASYYNEFTALKLKPVLDDLISNPRILEFPVEQGMSKTTTYLRVYRAWAWLIDNHPEKALYKKLKDESTLSNKSGRIRIIPTSLAPQEFTVNEVNPSMDSLMRLQNRISDFLVMEIKEDSMFDEPKLSLSQEQIDIIAASIPISEKIKLWIEPTRIRIMRKV